MRGFLLLVLLTPLGYGCSGMSTWTSPREPFAARRVCNNPVMVPNNHPEFVWEQIVDVMDDYFKIMEEMPVRPIMGSEGKLETYAEVGSTLLEPWRHDSANFEERLECTLQSIRRQAVVRVKMVEDGYMIDVAVYKQLEDLAKPQNAIAGSATFAYSSTQVGVIDPITDEPLELGWIPQGRDTALEQRILGEIIDRLGMISTQCQSNVCQPTIATPAACVPTVTTPADCSPIVDTAPTVPVAQPTEVPWTPTTR